MSVTAGELNQIRAELQRVLLQDTCTIPRVTPGTVNADGSTEPGTTATLTYPCAVGPLGGSPQEQVIAQRIQDVTGFVVTLPWNADVNERDTIHWGAQVLQVEGVIAPRSLQMNLRVATKRIS